MITGDDEAVSVDVTGEQLAKLAELLDAMPKDGSFELRDRLTLANRPVFGTPHQERQLYVDVTRWIGDGGRSAGFEVYLDDEGTELARQDRPSN